MPGTAVREECLVRDIVAAVAAGDDIRIDRLLRLLVQRAGLADLLDLRARLLGPRHSCGNQE
ncbi:hypothetical protein [Streptomyces erythrochromogenes]|uniref:hypothetical protein n=1 Tax=Streptomyces erythrochromogenes TaxID=285574 RepID=UPI0036A80304